MSAGRDLTVAAGADIIKIEKGAATSGWLFSRIRNQAKARNRHLAEWRFLRFLMMIVTVKLPMCIVIRMVSPPFGKCGQPPAVVVQRLAAEAALPVYHDSTGFARVALIYKKKRPEPKFGSLFGAEDGTFPRANQQSTGLLVPALRCRRPVQVLSSEYQTKIPMAGYAMGTFVWCGRWDLNPHVIDTRTSNVPVCRFQHFRKSHLTARKILAHLGV